MNGAAIKTLQRELQEMKDREEALRRAAQQAEAEAAVQAILDRVEAGEYDEHAAAIAAFLHDWNAAHRLAAAAGVATPHRRLRYRVLVPEHVRPAVMESYQMYVHEKTGEPTHGEHPYKDDGTLDRSRTREQRWFRRERHPAEKVRAIEDDLPGIDSLVNLPRIGHDRPQHWPPVISSTRKAGEA